MTKKKAEVKKEEVKTSGIVLIGIGIQYIHWAVNMCVSLKSHADVSVSLITTKDSEMFLEPDEINLFNDIIHVYPEHLLAVTEDELQPLTQS